MIGDDENFESTEAENDFSDELSEGSYSYEDDEKIIDNKRTRISCDTDKIDYGHNKIIELDRYWPHGMATKEPVNPNLLFIGCSVSNTSLICKHCPDREYVELSQFVSYGSYPDFEPEVRVDEHPKAYHKYLGGIDKKDKEKFCSSTFLVLRPTCCGKKSEVSTRLSMFDDHFVPSKYIRLFYQKYKIFAYLMIDPETIQILPKILDFRFSELLENAYLKGYFQEDQVTGLCDTFDFPEAVIPGGFKLKLRDYQLRSISWMMSLESIESLEHNTIFHSIVQKDEEIFLKMKLGHSPYYVGFAGYKDITESPETVKSEPLRLRGGILADDTGSGKTITTLGLIHASPFTKDHEIQRSLRF